MNKSNILKLIFAVLLIFSLVSCTSQQRFTYYGDEPTEEIKQEAQNVIKQTQSESTQLQIECTKLVCEAQLLEDWEIASNSCDKTVNRPGYIAYSYPRQYLEAKTIILINMNKSEEAIVMLREYKELVERVPSAKEHYQPYFDCFNFNINEFDAQCLNTNFCSTS